MRDLWFAVALCLLGFSCERDHIFTDRPVILEFSSDTVWFDTIFTTVGSTTQQLKVYNPEEDYIRIDEIRLAGGEKSVFRINIDGDPATRASEVELPPGDSMYIFVEVTMDPNNGDGLLMIHDSIVFVNNGNIQDVDIVAWGQDVHKIDGEIIGTTTWTADKPYLIINSMLVDTQAVLNIEAGARLHFHRESRMYVAGTLIAGGEQDQPVIMEGDRLEKMYQDIPGQWDGIWFLPGSKDNDLRYVHMKNAIIGIRADTLGGYDHPTVRLSGCRIENMTSAAIYGLGTTIVADNCLFANCGQYLLALTIGGSYEFYHCTMANYWKYSSRSTPSVVLNNYYEDIYGNIQLRAIDKAFFGNCIIYGSHESEFETDKHPGGIMNFTLDHCLARIDDRLFDLEDREHFNALINQEDPLFASVVNSVFEPDSLSPALDAGSVEIAEQFPEDMNGVNRLSDAGPDLGAFEKTNP